MLKRRLKNTLKTLGVLPFMEKLNFQVKKIKNRRINTAFKKENPFVALPPDYYMYETFALDYSKIYFGGLETATWIVDHFEKHIIFKDKCLLDWGCGSGRVIRHLPSILDTSNKVYGTDYNLDYVRWCQNNIVGADIRQNKLSPPLSFEEDFFDAIYGISIFTHLSQRMHFAWMKELNRVINENGILLLTTHGNSFREKLSKNERQLFDSGELVEHSYKIEGNRLYASYQSPMFFEKLCITNGFKILEHIKGEKKNNKPQQDVWILRRNN